jgi:hypothetical protein
LSDLENRIAAIERALHVALPGFHHQQEIARAQIEAEQPPASSPKTSKSSGASTQAADRDPLK